MFSSLFQRRKRLVSLTIEDDAIRYVELKSISPLVVECSVEKKLPANIVVDGKIVDFESLAAILEEAVTEWKIAKRFVRFLAPDQYVIIRKVPYPIDMMEDELKGYFFIEIGSTIYLPFDDPVFDVVPYKMGKDAAEAILIVSKESILDSYEEVFKNVKLDPIVADISPLALYRLSHLQYAFSGSEHILIADVKGDKMSVSIFNEHYPLFMRSIDLSRTSDFSFNEEDFNETDSQSISQIVSELEKLTNFYRYNMLNGSASITHILLNGEFEKMDELLASIHDRMGIQAGNLLKTPIQLADGQTLHSRFNRTVGLALKEV